jgi:hypothetical protein
MDQITFVATWDETGSVGVIYLTKNELEEYVTSAESHNGKQFTSTLINYVITVGLSEVRGEFRIETNDLVVFKTGLIFEICWIPEENLKSLQQSKEYLKYASMYPAIRTRIYFFVRPAHSQL